jgi:uncharacterized membrane protein YdjX (TVP38/TMEM64 family)
MDNRLSRCLLTRKKFFLGGAVIFTVVLLYWISKSNFVITTMNWIKNLDPFSGALFFIIIYIVFMVLMLPGALLTICAGFINGILIGGLLSWAGAFMGSIVCFMVGRKCTINDQIINDLFDLQQKVSNWERINFSFSSSSKYSRKVDFTLSSSRSHSQCHWKS